MPDKKDNFINLNTPEDIFKVKSTDGQEAIIAAIQAIIDARQKHSGGKGGGDQQIEIDPELKRPTPGDREENEDDDHTKTEIDDPDKLLKGSEDDSKSSESQDSDSDKQSSDSSADSNEDSSKVDDQSLKDTNGDSQNDKEGQKDQDDQKDGKGQKDSDIDDEINSKIGGKSKRDSQNKDTQSDDRDSQVGAGSQELLNQDKQQINDLKRASDLAEKVASAAEKNKEKKKISESDIERIKKDKEKIDELLQKKKSGEDVDNEDIDQAIKQTLADIGKIMKVDVDKNTKVRVQKISQDLTSARTRDELGKEDIENRIKDTAAEREKQEISRKIRSNDPHDEYSNVRPISDFEVDFYNSVRDQIQRIEAEDQTYSVLNSQAEDEDIIRQGTDTYDTLQFERPHICMYVDRSGSWNQSDWDKAQRAIKSVEEFRAQGKITLDVKYFSDSVITKNPWAKFPGGTRSWIPIMEDINNERYNNVILVTDFDMNSQAANASELWVPGEVWFIWKNRGSRSSAIVQKLRGEMNPNRSQEYALYE